MTPADHQGPSLRFGAYGWSWPTGSLDLLLRAALDPNQDRALTSAERWLDTCDIATATFRDHRLLTAISGRFGKALARHPAYPRLIGLRRQLWAKSRMAIDEATPTLRSLVDAGIPLLLTKGASRTAVDSTAETMRVAHDIDIVVDAQNLEGAVAVLARCGWQAASGASLKCLATRLQSIQSMNFFFGAAGDIDLHRDAYPGERDDLDERRMWQAAESGVFHEVAVLVPSAADRAALAIAHGALGAHTHSDWMIDCVAAVNARDFSWPSFCQIIARRKLHVAATVVLSYLALAVGAPVPAGVLEEVTDAAGRTTALARFASLLEAKPRTDMSPPLHLARWIAKKARQKRERTSRGQGADHPILRGRRAGGLWPQAVKPGAPLALVQRLELPPGAFRGEPTALSLLLEVAVPPLARRIEMEINSASGHVARLRYRKLGRRSGLLRLHFGGELHFEPDAADLTVESRPIRQVRVTDAIAAARFGALPFRLVSVQVAATTNSANPAMVAAPRNAAGTADSAIHAASSANEGRRRPDSSARDHVWTQERM